VLWDIKSQIYGVFSTVIGTWIKRIITAEYDFFAFGKRGFKPPIKTKPIFWEHGLFGESHNPKISFHLYPI
jgi:hypothetical protein